MATPSDYDDMQAAFQAFMRNGGSASGKKKKTNQGSKITNLPSPVPKASPNDPANHQRCLGRQKARKQYWQILNAFRKNLREDWLEVDDHLGQVVSAIGNLRDRIHMTSKQLWDWRNNPPMQSSCSGGFGYRKRPSTDSVLGCLTQQDLELALSHGLIQHEKMLSGARKLVSSLNQAQEALGRRLEELWIFHSEISLIMGDDDDDDGLALFAAHVVSWTRHVYTGMADELYRKQCLVQLVADSVNDGLVYLGQYDDLDGETSPRKVAEKCLQDWPRGGSKENRDNLSYLLSATGTPWEDTKLTTDEL